MYSYRLRLLTLFQSLRRLADVDRLAFVGMPIQRADRRAENAPASYVVI
jgi:hypothetical protein